MIRTSRVLLLLSRGGSWTGAASLPQDEAPASEPQADRGCDSLTNSEKSVALLQASKGMQRSAADNVGEASAGILPQIAKVGEYREAADRSASRLDVGNATPHLSIAELANQDVLYPPLQTEEEFAYDYPRDDNPNFKPGEGGEPAPPPFTPHSVGTATASPASPETIDRLKEQLEKARKNANRSMTKRNGLSDVWVSARDALESDRDALKELSDKLDEVQEKLDEARKIIKNATTEEASLTAEKKTLNKSLANESAAEEEAHRALEFSIATAQEDEQKVAELEGKLKKLAPEEALAARTLLSSAAVLLCVAAGAQSL